MPDSQQLHDVLINLRRVIRATDLQSKRVVKKCGLTIPQIMVLSAIHELGDVTVKRISDNVSLSQATVTTILNRLEDRVLVERVRAQKDKRIVNARLTDEGRTMLDNAPPLLNEKFIDRFDDLESWEKNQILSTLQRIASMMDAENIDTAPLSEVSSDTF